MKSIASHVVVAGNTVLMLALLAGIRGYGAEAYQGGLPRQLMRDPSFESVPPGPLASTGGNATWEVQRTGRDSIRDRLAIACVEDKTEAHSGRRALSLSIPKETVGFEFVTVGQRLGLDAGEVYEASLWVRWAEGPDEPPAGATATSAHRSAIVSFWARHRDGKGAFAGRDEWLFDNRWHKLAFRFCAQDPDQRTLVYVSLLPNQKPADTTVLIDDFALTTMDAPGETESRSGNMVEDSGFDAQQTGGIIQPWSFVNMGGTSISAAVAGDHSERWLAFQMPPATSNYESAQLRQYLDLRRGVSYEISCRMRWDNFTPGTPPPIVNYGIYDENSRTWYGPIDQVLETNGSWNTYRFVHVPPRSGRWKLYVQVNGWGNFGRAVAVSLDDLRCVACTSSQPKKKP